MKEKLFSILTLIVITTQMVHSQNQITFRENQTQITFSEFISYINCETLNEFDKKMRKKGFFFKESTETPKGEKAFVYQRREEAIGDVNGKRFSPFNITHTLIYLNFEDGSTFIALTTMSTKTFENIKNAIDDKINGFECKMESPKSNTIEYSCHNSSYRITIQDKKTSSENHIVSTYEFIIRIKS